MLKCVEQHGREDVEDPWSVRQYLVYQHSSNSDNESAFVVVNPSASRMLRDKLIVLQNAKTNLPCRTKIHLMMVAAATENWSTYVSWLESKVHPLVSTSGVCCGM